MYQLWTSLSTLIVLSSEDSQASQSSASLLTVIIMHWVKTCWPNETAKSKGMPIDEAHRCAWCNDMALMAQCMNGMVCLIPVLHLQAWATQGSLQLTESGLGVPAGPTGTYTIRRICFADFVNAVLNVASITALPKQSQALPNQSWIKSKTSAAVAHWAWLFRFVKTRCKLAVCSQLQECEHALSCSIS